MEKYPNKQIRLQKYDYSQPGYYFITVCAKDKVEYFGKVENGKMIPNEIGKIVERIWNLIPESYPCVALDNFIVMPNHLHGIIIIQPHNDGTPLQGYTLWFQIHYLRLLIILKAR